jgi:SAM-dependent methyltransferase
MRMSEVTTVCKVCASVRTTIVFVGEDIEYLKNGRKFTVRRCEECGLGFISPQPDEFELRRHYPLDYYRGPLPRQQSGSQRFSRRLSGMFRRALIEEYYNYPTEVRSRLWRRVRRLLLFFDWLQRVARGREVLPYVGSGKLLDVGCGVGVNLKSFQGLGWDVTGVEMSAAAATKARELVGDCIHIGALENIALPEESFDLIVFSHSLEHFYNPKTALLRARQLLKPRGLLVIIVPNAKGLERQLFGRYWVGWDLPRHLYHFGLPSLLALLRISGFKSVRVRTGTGSAFFMASLRKYALMRWGRAVPAGKLVERGFVRPLTLIAGHLGYGTELKVHAVKSETAVSDQQPAFSLSDQISSGIRADR